MANFDLILLFFLVGFMAAGFFAGLFQTLGSIIGTFAGYYIAIRNYANLASWLEPIFYNNHVTASIISFIVIFLIINRLVGLFVWVLAKSFQWLKFIPFFTIMNRIAGGILGLIEGLIVIGIVLKTADIFIGSSSLADAVAGSSLAQLLVNIADWYSFILPKLIETVS
jgi:uncharacterized membrane protein required for colicin V production